MGGGHFRSEKLCCAFSIKGKRYGHQFPGQKRNIFFPKIGWGGGGGPEAVWKFFENSSNLVQVTLPNIEGRFSCLNSLPLYSSDVQKIIHFPA